MLIFAGPVKRHLSSGAATPALSHWLFISLVPAGLLAEVQAYHQSAFCMKIKCCNMLWFRLSSVCNFFFSLLRIIAYTVCYEADFLPWLTHVVYCTLSRSYIILQGVCLYCLVPATITFCWFASRHLSDQQKENFVSMWSNLSVVTSSRCPDRSDRLR